MNILLALFLTIPSTSAITFNCTYSYHDFIAIDKVYTCSANIFDVIESNVLIDVIGGHQEGKGNDDVHALEILNATRMSFIPQGIETFFPNLWALIIENHEIVELEGDELRNYNDLKLLGILHGKLEKISGDFFESTPYVTHLWLTQNKIRNISENFANYMENLMFADFTGNDCINQQATNSFEMSDLSENLRMNCTEGNVDAALVPRVMMESLIDDANEKKCEKGNEAERICKLEKENELLNQKIKELINEMESLKNKSMENKEEEEVVEQ